MTEYRFIRPLDVLFLRGNRLFGGPGDYAESLMPPRPSIMAGAIRSKLLGQNPDALAAFSDHAQVSDPGLHQALGTVDEPGDFRISLFSLARQTDQGLEWFLPLPADVLVTGDAQTLHIHGLQPQTLPTTIASSAALPQSAILRTAKQEKLTSGYWLNASGIAAYLNGSPLNKSHLNLIKDLWKNEQRLGIALDSLARSAAEGQIYTTDVIAMFENVGFLVGVDGADGFIPNDGLLRLGGDGRGAAIANANFTPPQPPWFNIQQTRRFRLLLTTPGLFAGGWLPDGVSEQNGTYRLQGQGFSARLVAAAVPRAEVVSGWDLARWCPKPALRAIPVGSVYWFDEWEGDAAELGKLAKSGWFGLSGDNAKIGKDRRAEGFNNVMIAAWPQGE
ncbi:MAG: type III-B CRISPR module-associated protein Cmr3 [Candidatus Methylumidiphilus sp.]